MKTTNKHFNLFVDECRKWIDRYGLTGWKVYFAHEDQDQESTASIAIKLEDRVATIYFCKTWRDEIRPLNDVQIKKVALHEITHLAVGRLSELAGTRYAGRSEVYEATEELARVIEHALESNETVEN